jgi:hypothetical protein
MGVCSTRLSNARASGRATRDPRIRPSGLPPRRRRARRTEQLPGRPVAGAVARRWHTLCVSCLRFPPDSPDRNAIHALERCFLNRVSEVRFLPGAPIDVVLRVMLVVPASPEVLTLSGFHGRCAGVIPELPMVYPLKCKTRRQIRSESAGLAVTRDHWGVTSGPSRK